jgi:hypothetical protein
MEDGMEAGLAYGIGIRIKPPFFPLGLKQIIPYIILNLRIVKWIWVVSWIISTSI